MITLFPQEIATKKIIPSLKGLIIHKMVDMGYSQHRIARLLEISQPQVHKYITKSRIYYYEYLEALGFDVDYIDRVVDIALKLLSKGDKPRFVLVLTSLIDSLSIQLLCETKPYFKELCRQTGNTLKFNDPFIEEYRMFLERLLVIRGLEKLIPEVGMNVVYAPLAPQDTTDVIGLPGRIVRRGDRAVAIGDPMYGASRHLARVLIIISKMRPEIRTASNIRYDERILGLLSNKKLNIAYTGPHGSQADFWRSIERVAVKKPDAIADRGGMGLEPVIYLFTESLDDMLSLIRYIAGKY